MILRYDNLKIELESQSEIETLWNIIMFALDYDSEQKKKGEPCMTDAERKFAKELANEVKVR